MLRQRITKTRADSVPLPGTGPIFLRDSELRGFALCVRPTGARSFVLERRIKGRNRRITLGRYPDLTVEQARHEAQKLLGLIATGIDPLARKDVDSDLPITLDRAFADFKAARKALKARTLYDYERVLRRAFRDWLELPLKQIGKDMVAKRHGHLGEHSGPAYANYAMRLLRAIYNFAIYQYEDAQGQPTIHVNPVIRLTQTRAWYRVPRRQTLIRPHQLKPWLKAVHSLRGGAPLGQPRTVAEYLLVLLFTGLRRQEAARLRWSDVDLVGATLTVRETKNGTPLELPLSRWLCGILALREETALTEFVFPGESGKGYLIEPRKYVAEVIRESGVVFTLHDLRRTFITIAESLDISAYAIKRLVNHRMSGDVTAGYVVSSPERLREPMERISRFILGSWDHESERESIPIREKIAL